jgi:hypothetical protein
LPERTQYVTVGEQIQLLQRWSGDGIERRRADPEDEETAIVGTDST